MTTSPMTLSTLRGTVDAGWNVDAVSTLDGISTPDGKPQVSAREHCTVSRPDDRRAEVLDENGQPLSMAGRVRLAFRRDPTKGAVVLLLLLFGVTFLVAGVVVFWNEIVSLFLNLF